ncbi:cytochrome bd menaquinol oxidase, subunit I [Geotalea daltonii FRC-32]|uniref:Cytochrome bd menaquinol oxidase, subunit I n=1 Tax=Geotalea daltonii (strain DSM 22248 / JCM 15807 / FRC-32) TaxID=316067 RepID=B9M2E4_GEODF|nr:cytochrome ubiquinol oxidase subunit I [Geotalea daltonii]ACM19323.1 cytochrome bd menaquinol oxidase, subunit I [Geotalea daltonii FRC-32]
MDNLLAARTLMGVSLAFHIIYATIGIGLPLMLMIAEGISLRNGNDLYHQMARRWVRPAGLLFAIGAVSGTILSFELGFLWPRFMAFSGALIGLAFTIEGFAFFTEAIFLALYIYGEKRLSRRALFFCTIPITVAAAASAVFVISANGWMNTPSGFRMVDGMPADLHPLQALANPAWAHEAVHGTFAAYVATGFAVAGVYAFSILRGTDTVYHKKALTLALAVAGFFLPLMFISGDWAASFVAKHQKPKLAAMEAHFTTMAGAPLVIGGWPDPASGQVLYAVKIPKMLSVLAHREPNAVVEGLDAFPHGTAPDPRLVHPFFDLMVGSFFIMAGVSCWFWWRRWQDKAIPAGKRLLQAVLIASPFGMIALESGWFVTEFGRQPWIVQKHMTVAQGVTSHPDIDLVLAAFVTVYVLMSIGLLKLLLRPAGERSATRKESFNVDP